jgi:hypothetical protein
LGLAEADKLDPGEMIVMFSGLTSGGSATIALSLLDCDTVGGTYAAITPVNITVPATAYNNALWADTIRMPLPRFGVRQFVKLRYTVGTAALTAGALTAGMVK